MRDAITSALADRRARAVVIASAVSEYLSASAALRELERMKTPDMRQGATPNGSSNACNVSKMALHKRGDLSSCERTPIEKPVLSIDTLNAMSGAYRRTVSK